MRLFLLVCAGGAVGSGARYLVYQGVIRWLGAEAPWATLTVNIVGSFLMGLVIAVLTVRREGAAELQALLATGVLGGFTTFSAFSLDVVTLAERGAPGLALAYIVASVAVSVLALAGGLTLMRSLAIA